MMTRFQPSAHSYLNKCRARRLGKSETEGCREGQGPVGRGRTGHTWVSRTRGHQPRERLGAQRPPCSEGAERWEGCGHRRGHEHTWPWVHTPESERPLS